MCTMLWKLSSFSLARAWLVLGVACCVLCCLLLVVVRCPRALFRALLCTPTRRRTRSRLRTHDRTRPLLSVPVLVPVLVPTPVPVLVPVLIPVPVLVHTHPCCTHLHACTRTRLPTRTYISNPYPSSHPYSYQPLLYPPSYIPVPGPVSVPRTRLRTRILLPGVPTDPPNQIYCGQRDTPLRPRLAPAGLFGVCSL